MSIKAMKQALTHEINLVLTDPESKLSGGAQRALQYVHQQIQAIAEAEKQEPVAYVTGVYAGRFTYAPVKASVVLPAGMAFYTTPQPAHPKEWVGLTDDEKVKLWQETETDNRMVLIDEIEAKLKAKNTQPAQPKEPLTDEQIGDIAALFYPRWQGHEGFARAIEAAHGIGILQGLLTDALTVLDSSDIDNIGPLKDKMRAATFPWDRRQTQEPKEPLTDEQIDEATQQWAGHAMVSIDRLIMCREYARAIEAAHGIKK